jgi:hypothetical protein
MENTVNKNPDDSPGVTSKMSESSSSVDFPPQAVITWLLVSVAVGLVTIYTMIQFISKKLTKVGRSRHDFQMIISSQL